MSDIDGLLALIPVGDIARKLGISEDVAQGAVAQVVPTLLGGMAANAKDDSGAASLEKALSRHAGVFPGTSVSEVDTADGEKIVSNVFGSKKNDVVAAVASTGDSTITQDIIARILPIVAPIVIGWLASQFLGGKQAEPAKPAAAPAPSGGIGDLLGGLLGGSLGGSKGGAGGGDLIGSVLGGLLGGGKR
ncbi:hypothetical protein IWX81_002749 [Salinibacterium sp. CAN_S4]|uniref:DUF937 domain-containing protein n=1 Tax=Salinibacterium sp. CAN_S4 TaxID=2787727 RepID=UPI0018EF8DD8